MKLPIPLCGWARIIAKSVIVGFLLILTSVLTRAFRVQALYYLSISALAMLWIWTGGKLLFCRCYPIKQFLLIVEN